MQLPLTDPHTEERDAHARHRHMDRMRQAAEQARERDRRQTERLQLRDLRDRHTEAARNARAACRDYNHALRRAYSRPGRPYPDQADRELDRAYGAAHAACNHERRLRALLEEATNA